MEYHNDRFEDYSLLIHKNNKLVAVLPANKKEDTVYSHQGLTYGGLVISSKIKLPDYIVLFQEVLQFLESQKITTLELKELPNFYSAIPAEEVGYLAQLTQAKITRIDTASVISYDDKLPIYPKRLAGARKAQKQGLVLKEETIFSTFWDELLLPNLKQKYGALPTHTSEEIQLLHQLFPKNIRQFNVYKEDILVAGATVFETKTTAHIQYLSGNKDKQQLGSLDILFEGLINKTFAHKKYFDFGTSNENQGKTLNSGLAYWKECFGARTMLHRFYSFDTSSHSLLNSVI